jgi:hypothetical protein
MRPAHPIAGRPIAGYGGYGGRYYRRGYGVAVGVGAAAAAAGAYGAYGYYGNQGCYYDQWGQYICPQGYYYNRY